MRLILAIISFINIVDAFNLPIKSRLFSQINNGASKTRSNTIKMVSVPHGGVLVNTMVKDNEIKNELISSCDYEVQHIVHNYFKRRNMMIYLNL